MKEINFNVSHGPMDELNSFFCFCQLAENLTLRDNERCAHRKQFKVLFKLLTDLMKRPSEKVAKGLMPKSMPIID